MRRQTSRIFSPASPVSVSNAKGIVGKCERRNLPCPCVASVVCESPHAERLGSLGGDPAASLCCCATVPLGH
eukprot:5447318-Pyramimonas_sp.AAC.1